MSEETKFPVSIYYHSTCVEVALSYDPGPTEPGNTIQSIYVSPPGGIARFFGATLTERVRTAERRMQRHSRRLMAGYHEIDRARLLLKLERST